jgi:hypothetical protein
MKKGLRQGEPAMDEIWKPIEDTEYFVSNFGVIQGPRKVLKQRLNPGGYLIVCIWRKDGTRFTRPVHRIVCDTFLLIPSGEKHYRAKLRLEQVNIIRESNETAKNLGKIYGVSKCAIDRIRNGRSWKHYPAEKLRAKAQLK